MSSYLSNIQGLVNASAPNTGDDGYGNIKGEKVRTADVDVYARTHLGQANETKKASWDTGLDAGVGAVDKQIKDQDAVKGTSAFGGDAAYTKLTEQRAALNAQRWATANISGSPAKDRLRVMLQSGQLSYQDLGKIDISTLGNDSGLASAIDGLVAAKAPPALPSTVAPPPDPVAKAGSDAQPAVNDQMGGVAQGASNIMNLATGAFDKSVRQAGAGIESTSNQAAMALGGAAAGNLASEAGAGLQANATAEREVAVSNAKSDIQKFVDSHLAGAVNNQIDVTSMDTDAKHKLHTQGLSALKDQLTKSVDMSDTKAAGQVQAVSAAIDDWHAALKRGEEGTAEMNKVLGIAGGIIMAGAAAGGIALTDGAATPFLAPVVGAGITTAASAARS